MIEIQGASSSTRPRSMQSRRFFCLAALVLAVGACGGNRIHRGRVYNVDRERRAFSTQGGTFIVPEGDGLWVPQETQRVVVSYTPTDEGNIVRHIAND